MPIESFEAERAAAEAPAENVNDFDFLLAEIRETSPETAAAKMASWLERFERGYANTPDQWSMLVDLLPRATDVRASLENFAQLLLPATREPTSADLFFANPPIAARLSSYAWTDFLGPHASNLVAGCLNVARAASRGESPSSTLMGTLSTTVANYPLTLIGIALHDPALVVATPDGCVLADTLDVARERFGKWSFDQALGEVRGLLLSFDVEPILRALHALLGREDLAAAHVMPFAKVALDADDERLAAALGAFAFESPEISAVLKERCLQKNGADRAAALELWARYLAQGDAFLFGWECVRPGAEAAPAPFGDEIDGRLKRLEQLLRIPSSLGPRAQFSDRLEWSWREPTLRAIAAIGALAAKKWTARDDQAICENEAVNSLVGSPELLPQFLGGLFDHAHAQRDVLDPLILKVPADRLVPILTTYTENAAVWSEARHRAARLLTQAKGEAVLGDRGETATAPEATLPEPRRERTPLTAQTWFGEGTMERLWHVALEVGQTRYDECMAERYADDKDDHCAALGDVIARALNGTNAALKMWLKWNGAAPPTIRASVRRSSTKSKRAAAGLQADIAFLVRCNLAGKCVTKRLTLMRAKKLPASSTGDGFAPDFRVLGAERTNLTRLLTLSTSTHYLFVMPKAVGDSLRVLPAALVRDLLASQGFGGSIPVRTVVQAGMRLPEFLLFNVLGLWTGDDDPDVVAKAEADADPDQSPHVVVEINVSREDAEATA